MTQSQAYPMGTADSSYWRIPGIFLRDTLMNAFMFFALAAAAFLVDWSVRWLEAWGLTNVASVFLHGTSYVLLVTDVIAFIAIQIFLVRSMFKERRHS
jgi:hypothetical protein